MEGDIVVSIVCLAYNHGKYIRQALEGFVSQETDFPFEVVIHDDASTDDTAGIIREYEQKYPEIIKPIYQTQNQFSLGASVKKEFMLPLIRGEFVAVCEGDDYWTDRHKLKKQVDMMRSHGNCSMCVHKVTEVFEEGTPDGVTFPGSPLEGGVLSSRAFFEIGREYSFHTSSYFFRGDQYREYVGNPPEFVGKCDVGDEAYMLYFGQLGDVYYIDETMSCYRRGVLGSWSGRNRTNVEKLIRHGNCMIETLKSFDSYTGNRFHDICVQRISRQMAITTVLEKNTAILLKKENAEYYRCLSKSRKLFAWLGAVMPGLMRRIYIYRITALSKKRGVV